MSRLRAGTNAEKMLRKRKKLVQQADSCLLYYSLQENRPLPKAFFTTMMEIEKKQVSKYPNLIIYKSKLTSHQCLTHKYPKKHRLYWRNTNYSNHLYFTTGSSSVMFCTVPTLEHPAQALKGFWNSSGQTRRCGLESVESRPRVWCERSLLMFEMCSCRRTRG